MTTQLTKPSRTKARYTEEYKQEALELWRGQRPQRGEGRSRHGCHYTEGEMGVGPHFLHFFIDPLWVEPGSVCESCSF
jgi:hypothetical protein